LKQVQIRPIRNGQDHASALSRIENLMDAQLGTKEIDELEVLGQLVKTYETKRWPIEVPTAVAALNMEWSNLAFSAERSGLSSEVPAKFPKS